MRGVQAAGGPVGRRTQEPPGQRRGETADPAAGPGTGPFLSPGSEQQSGKKLESGNCWVSDVKVAHF